MNAEKAEESYRKQKRMKFLVAPFEWFGFFSFEK